MSYFNSSVSVIIPCFRCSETIARAIESIDRQTLRPKEVILIDDCSGDETLAELGRLKAMYPAGWITVFSLKRNAGPATARNAGLDIATQDYIAFLDADDSWHPRKIELQYIWMCDAPEAVITGHKCIVVPDSKCCEDIENTVVPLVADRISLNMLLLRNRFQTPSVMVKRTAFIKMVEDKKYSEDYHAWLKILAAGGGAYYFDAPLAFLHKPEYGGAGLSGDMWKMELGELDTYRRIYRDGDIGFATFLVFCGISIVKYLRRLVMVRIRRK